MESKSRRILLVDDDRENIDLLTEYLSREGHIVTAANEAQGALHRIKAWRPHLILLDINMPGLSGIELIPKIREVTSDDYAAIVLVSSNMDMETIHHGLDAGADDYLTKPFRTQELAARVRAMVRLKDLQDSLRRANHRIEELALNDDLTGLYNARALQRRADEEIMRCRRFRKPISALLVNIDRFSSINETSGFDFGSHVLKMVGGFLKECVRSVDMVGRIGADEFLVILPETDLSGAEFVAERIRDTTANNDLKSDKQTARVSVCIGIAAFTPDQSQGAEGNLSELFKNATEALRSAKAGGANRVEIYSFA